MLAPHLDSIDIHSAQAPYYKYRTIYLPAFFQEVAQYLRLDKQSVLLDACCGCGELSQGLIGYVARAYGIDGSREMLLHAERHDNISYHLCDINHEVFRAPEPVDHIVIGRAAHWLAPESLKNLVQANLKTGGTVLVCSTQWVPVGDWGAAYREVLSCYKTRIPRIHDFTGRETLGKIGFLPQHTLAADAAVGFGLDYLVNHILSEAYGEDLERMVTGLARLRSEIHERLSGFTTDGKLLKKVTSWAISYKAA